MATEYIQINFIFDYLRPRLTQMFVIFVVELVKPLLKSLIMLVSYSLMLGNFIIYTFQVARLLGEWRFWPISGTLMRLWVTHLQLTFLESLVSLVLETRCCTKLTVSDFFTLIEKVKNGQYFNSSKTRNFYKK